jgi:hypothetical protein
MPATDLTLPSGPCRASLGCDISRAEGEICKNCIFISLGARLSCLEFTAPVTVTDLILSHWPGYLQPFSLFPCPIRPLLGV